MEYHTPSLKLY